MGLLFGTDFVGYAIRLTALPILAYLGVFAWGLISAVIDPEGAAAYWSYFRNLVEIILSMGAVLIFVALGVFIVQVARFINLLYSEIKPISEDTKLAVKNVRVTAEFVQKHGIMPIIRFQAFLTGLIAFLSELIHLTRILQQRERDAQEDNEAQEDHKAQETRYYD
jgi:TRAP-type C4-dicarboxylate transport system permease small subunit